MPCQWFKLQALQRSGRFATRTGGSPVRRSGAGDLFLGVALGLFDWPADLFQRRSTVSGRLQTADYLLPPRWRFALTHADL